MDDRITRLSAVPEQYVPAPGKRHVMRAFIIKYRGQLMDFVTGAFPEAAVVVYLLSRRTGSKPILPRPGLASLQTIKQAKTR